MVSRPSGEMSMHHNPHHSTAQESRVSVLNASIEDFEARDFSPTIPDMPALHHSGGLHSVVASEYSEASSERRSYSPPAWRKAGSGWFQQQPSLSPSRHAFGNSRDPSPQYHSADEGDALEREHTGYLTAMRIPLPESPIKGRSPSNSPDPREQYKTEDDGDGGERMPSAPPMKESERSPDLSSEPSNYIRFTGSIAVQQRTDAIDWVVYYTRAIVAHVTKSRYNTILYAVASLILYWLVANLIRTPTIGPLPDLIKVAGLAQSFEPVIYYSEAGHAQIGELQDTGVAVWDLSESVRASNMTSAPIIVTQLEELAESLKQLSIEMTSFFSGLEADVDAILYGIEYATRELTILSQTAQSTVVSVWSNAHALLIRTGLVSSENRILQDLIGQTIQQHTRATLERAFNDFLNTMEECIANEMQYTLQLFGLFEGIDGQFLNLHRTVVREQDAQERSQADFLSSLWTKVAGVDAARLRKYERNRALLQSVRDRTVRNKHVLVEHNRRLLQMRASLDILRRRLVSPLVRAAANASSASASALSVEAQVEGLESTYRQLKLVRDAQKQKKMALLYEVRQQRDHLQVGAGFRSMDDASIGR